MRFKHILVAAAAVVTGASGVLDQPVEAAVGGTRAVMLMPFRAGGWTGDEYPGGAHPKQLIHDVSRDPISGAQNGFGWDLHSGDAGTPVLARFRSTDGRVTIRVGFITDNKNGSGKRVEVQVLVAGSPVGTVFFSHLRSPQVNPHTEYPVDTLLGYLAEGERPDRKCRSGDGTSDGWTYSNSWQVCSPGGIHTHLDVSHGCYRSMGLSESVEPTTPILMLSTAHQQGSNAQCDNTEMETVTRLPIDDRCGAGYGTSIAMNLRIGVPIDGSHQNGPDEGYIHASTEEDQLPVTEILNSPVTLVPGTDPLRLVDFSLPDGRVVSGILFSGVPTELGTWTTDVTVRCGDVISHPTTWDVGVMP